MMSEYILKSDAIKAIQKYGVGCLNTDDFSPEQCERFVINKLNELPSVTLPTTKNDLAVDCIDRNKAYEIIENWAEAFDVGTYFDNEQVKEIIMACANRIDELPSVTPIRPKGHWIEEFNDLEGEVRFTCSSCGKYQLFGTDFCYYCGSDNREVEK